MKLQVTLILLIIAFGHKANSQERYVDSLIENTRPENPYESRVNSVNLLIQHYQYRNKELAFSYIDTLFKIAHLADDSFRIGIAWSYSADTYLMSSNYELARECALKTDSIAKAIENNLLLFGSNNTLGMIDSDQGNFHNAIAHYELGLQAARESNDSLKQAVILSNLGGAYLNLGNHKEAISKMFRALDFLESDNSEERKGITMSSISGAFLGLRDYEKAIKYGTKAVEKFRKTGHMHTMPVALNNIGEALNSQGNYDEAIDKFRESIIFAKAADSQFSLSYCYHGLGNSFLELNELDSAFVYYNKALDIEKEFDMKLEQSSSLASIGEIHLRNRNYVRAKNYFKKAEKLAVETKTLDELTDIKRFLIETNLAIIGNKEIQAYLTEFRAAKDSLYNSDKLLAISEVEAKYQVSVKEKEIAEMKVVEQIQITKIRNYIIGLLLVGLISLFLFLRNQKVNIRNVLLKTENEKIAVEKVLAIKEKERAEEEIEKLEVLNHSLFKKNEEMKKKLGDTDSKYINKKVEIGLSDRSKRYFEYREIVNIFWHEKIATIVTISGDTYTVRASAPQFFREYIDEDYFMQVSKSDVINTLHIKKITPDYLLMHHAKGKIFWGPVFKKRAVGKLKSIVTQPIAL